MSHGGPLTACGPRWLVQASLAGRLVAPGEAGRQVTPLSHCMSSGHSAEAQRQILEQGVEEEIRHPVRQWATHLPPQPARESLRRTPEKLGWSGGRGSWAPKPARIWAQIVSRVTGQADSS